jgi:S1-C subfamily serine protease
MAVRHRRIFLAVATLSIIAVSGQGAARELDLGALLAPVIALEARIPEHARSAQSLGTVRGGTGVLIDGAGLVLTIGYLILEADAVELLPDGLRGERVPADVVAWDPITGLGLVRSKKALGIAPMALGDSATLKTEDAVITASWTREAGMLPAFIVDRGPYAGYWEYLLEDALYVSPIHPAFPGAALIGLDGKLVGIGGFAHFDSGDEEEVADSVFIPIDALKPILADLLLDGRSAERRPWLGLYCEEEDGGLRVRRVPADGPAASAGILAGDRLVAVAGTPVDSLVGFYRHLWSVARPGDSIVFELKRDEAPIKVEILAIDRHERGGNASQ